MIKLPCGGTAYFDGCGHRCETCMTVVGSIGQPKLCKEIEQKYETLKKYGGKGWDYTNGRQEQK